MSHPPPFFQPPTPYGSGGPPPTGPSFMDPFAPPPPSAPPGGGFMDPFAPPPPAGSFIPTLPPPGPPNAAPFGGPPPSGLPMPFADPYGPPPPMGPPFGSNNPPFNRDPFDLFGGGPHVIGGPPPPYSPFGPPPGHGYGDPYGPGGFDANRANYGNPYGPPPPGYPVPYGGAPGSYHGYPGGGYPSSPHHPSGASMDFQHAASTSLKQVHKTFASDHDLLRVNFFGHVRSMLKRDYTIVIDKSGSMAGGFWNHAKNALIKIAPFCCKADPDGVTVYFFSSPGRHPKFDHIKDPVQVEEMFRKESPGGSTDLGGVLEQVFDNHFSKGHNPETILVITDGAPDDKAKVKRAIVRATQQVTCDEELSVSFIQIGTDPQAHNFLKELDSHLDGAKYDIVDEITMEQMGKLSFEELIEKSIQD